MILRQPPLNLEKLLKVDQETSDQLHESGIPPLYMYDGFFYYEKTKSLMELYQQINGGETLE